MIRAVGDLNNLIADFQTISNPFQSLPISSKCFHFPFQLPPEVSYDILCRLFVYLCFTRITRTQPSLSIWNANWKHNIWRSHDVSQFYSKHVINGRCGEVRGRYFWALNPPTALLESYFGATSNYLYFFCGKCL